MAIATPHAGRLSTGKPLFIPLGYSRHGVERWLHIRVDGEDRTYRPTQALGMAFLLGIYPDHDHWARMYPSRYYNGQRLDWRSAVSHITRLCIAAGEYKPAPTVSGEPPTP